MIYIPTLKRIAEEYKKTLVNKSGLKHIEEIRVQQRLAIDEFVNKVIKEYEQGTAKY
jgi:hypothetical protein